MPKPILVTGATGFVGSSVARARPAGGARRPRRGGRVGAPRAALVASWFMVLNTVAVVPEARTFYATVSGRANL